MMIISSNEQNATVLGPNASFARGYIQNLGPGTLHVVAAAISEGVNCAPVEPTRQEAVDGFLIAPGERIEVVNSYFGFGQYFAVAVSDDCDVRTFASGG